MKKLLFMGAAMAVLAAGSAQAQDDWRKGLYIKGGAGWNHTQDQDISGGTEAELDEGVGLTGAVGYDFGDMRTEMEVTFRKNGVDGLSAGASLPSPDGDMQSTAFMANGYYDLPVGGPVKPYIGGGIGVAHVNVKDYSTAGTTVADEDDNVFAYQAMAGMEYAVNNKVDLYTEYKYFATEDVDFGGGAEGDYRNHAIMAGLKYSLN